jgi:hypothetical protein
VLRIGILAGGNYTEHGVTRIQTRFRFIRTPLSAARRIFSE